jgi:hypothetical protein
MKSILIFGDDRETPAYVLKVSDKELAALEKANLIYIEASEAKDEKDTKQHAFNHIGVDLLRIADQVAEVSPKNFKELVPIFLERKTRKALMNLLATKAFEGMTYSHFVEMSMGSFVRGVTRKPSIRRRCRSSRRPPSTASSALVPRQRTWYTPKPVWFTATGILATTTQ